MKTRFAIARCCCRETPCKCNRGTYPDSWTVQVAGITNGRHCTSCGTYNAAYILTKNQTQDCLWCYNMAAVCDDEPYGNAVDVICLTITATPTAFNVDVELRILGPMILVDPGQPLVRAYTAYRWNRSFYGHACNLSNQPIPLYYVSGWDVCGGSPTCTITANGPFS